MTKRPGAITTIAILHFVFGGLWACCGACGLGGTAGQGAMLDFQKKMMEAQGPQNKEATRQIELQEKIIRLTAEKNPHGMTVQVIMSVTSVLFGIVLVVAGFGLLKLRPWARLVSIGYGVIDLLLGIVHLVWAIAVKLPAEAEVMKEMANDAEFQAMMKSMAQFGSFAGTGEIAILIFAMIYPVVVLVVMFLPNVVAAFRPGGASPQEPEPDDLRPEDRWRV